MRSAGALMIHPALHVFKKELCLPLTGKKQIVHEHNLQVRGLYHRRPILTDVVYKHTGRPKPVVLFADGFKGFKDWGHWQVIAQAYNKFLFLTGFAKQLDAKYIKDVFICAGGNTHSSKGLQMAQ